MDGVRANWNRSNDRDRLRRVILSGRCVHRFTIPSLSRQSNPGDRVLDPFRLVSILLVALIAIMLALACGESSSDTIADEDEPVIVVTVAGTTDVATTALAFTGTASPSSSDPSSDSQRTELAPAAEASDSSRTEPAIAPIDSTELQDEVGALIAGAGGITSAMMVPNGDVIYENMAYEPMEAASLYKLAVMVELFRERDAGEISFDDQVLLEPHHFAEGGDVFGEDQIGLLVDVGTLVDAMITASSNVAATALLQYAGTDNVNATVQSLGLTSTEIRWYPDGTGDPTLDEDEVPFEPDESGEPEEQDEPDLPDEPSEPEAPETGEAGRNLLRVSPIPFADERADNAWNVTSAVDLAIFYRMLLAGEVVSAEASEEMLDLLAGQGINDRLPAYLPAGTVVAHKTGNLEGLVHDVGIIYAPAGPIIVVVLTEDVDEVYAVDMIARIGLLAYELRP